MKYVNKYVIADDVNFIKSGWISRNYMLLDGKPFMFHLLLQGASPNKWIKDVTVLPDQRKLLRTIDLYYRKAPYFKNIFPMMEEIIRYEDKNLARYVGNSLIKIAEYLNFDTEFVYESENSACDRSLKAQERLISDCKLFGVTEYINAIGGTALYSKEDFKKAGINLYFLKSRPIEYKQFNDAFIPNLSILDVLMFNSVKQTNELLLQFDLV
jgi:hypothetical protein